MTVVTPQAASGTAGPAGVKLVRSELLKIRTISTWWIFSIGVVVTTCLSLLVSILEAHYFLKDTPNVAGAGADAAATLALQTNELTQAVYVFTSGQFLTGLFVMVLAILIVTNEYQHQTATTTFLTTPHRTSVVLAKFVTAMMAAAYFWVITTVLDLIGGSVYFPLDGLHSHLGDWSVIRGILINLLVFALWGVFGVGIGVLFRNQIGAVVTSILLYVVGSALAAIIATIIHQLWINRDWVLTAQVIVPAKAAEIAVSPMKTYPQSPPEWVGAAVLIGYGLLFGIIGTLIMRKRDIS
jgi:ABC-type transport system involved in multi-copper enzyme maturation permease subunit